MKGKTYYRYIWLLDLLLTSDPLPFEDICMMWEANPMSDGPLALRTFHEHRKGIKEMFGVKSQGYKGNVRRGYRLRPQEQYLFYKEPGDIGQPYGEVAATQV